jgi:predicted dehydrogenase
MEATVLSPSALEKLRVLVVGVGSIGERHIRNLWNLGITQISALRSRNLPYRDIGKASVQVVLDWDTIKKGDFDVAIICTPTHLHLSQTLKCVQLGMHVLVEKPLSHTLEGISTLAQEVAEQKVVFSVAYMMRYHPLLRELKQLIQSKSLGEVVYAESEWREYLPDWHPWEDYRTSYAALAEMGGGAALTLSHDLDTLCWLLEDYPETWTCKKAKHQSVETTADAIADFIFTFSKNRQGRVHVNMAAPIPQRMTRITFERGVVAFFYYKNELVVAPKGEAERVVCLPDFERNQLYVDELFDFLQKVVQQNFSENSSQFNNAEILTKIALS